MENLQEGLINVFVRINSHRQYRLDVLPVKNDCEELADASDEIFWMLMNKIYGSKNHLSREFIRAYVASLYTMYGDYHRLQTMTAKKEISGYTLQTNENAFELNIQVPLKNLEEILWFGSNCYNYNSDGFKLEDGLEKVKAGSIVRLKDKADRYIVTRITDSFKNEIYVIPYMKKKLSFEDEVCISQVDLR